MPDAQHLRRELERLEGGSYGSYKRLRGEYLFGAATLFIDRVQSDPFAAPSRLRVRVPMDETAFPRELLATPTRRLALADVLARGLSQTFRSGGPAFVWVGRQRARLDQRGRPGGTRASGHFRPDLGRGADLRRLPGLRPPLPRPRRIEIAAALNRLRSLRMR